MSSPIATVARATRASFAPARRAEIVTVPGALGVTRPDASTDAMLGLSTSNTIVGWGETATPLLSTATTISRTVFPKGMVVSAGETRSAATLGAMPTPSSPQPTMADAASSAKRNRLTRSTLRPVRVQDPCISPPCARAPRASNVVPLLLGPSTRELRHPRSRREAKSFIVQQVKPRTGAGTAEGRFAAFCVGLEAPVSANSASAIPNETPSRARWVGGDGYLLPNSFDGTLWRYRQRA